MKKFSRLIVLFMVLLGSLAHGQVIFEDHFNSGDWKKPQAGGADYWALNFSTGNASAVSEESGGGLKIVSYAQDTTNSSQVTVAGPVMPELNFFATPITITINNFQTASGGANMGPSSVISYFAVSNSPKRVPNDLDRAIYVQFELSGTLTLFAKTSTGTVELAKATGVNANIGLLQITLDATTVRLTYQAQGMAMPVSYDKEHGLTAEQWGGGGSSLEFGARVNATLDRSAILNVGSIAVVPEPTGVAMLGGGVLVVLAGRRIAGELKKRLHP